MAALAWVNIDPRFYGAFWSTDLSFHLGHASLSGDLQEYPWSSYVIVPLFALANAGVTISGGFLARAYSSPVTLGILVGYVVGKPAGTLGAAWLVTRISRGRVRPPIGWAAVAGAGAIAGIGFTVSLLIASLAFRGAALQEAKVGVLSAALCASPSPGSCSG